MAGLVTRRPKTVLGAVRSKRGGAKEDEKGRENRHQGKLLQTDGYCGTEDVTFRATLGKGLSGH